MSEARKIVRDMLPRLLATLAATALTAAAVWLYARIQNESHEWLEALFKDLTAEARGLLRAWRALQGETSGAR